METFTTSPPPAHTAGEFSMNYEEIKVTYTRNDASAAKPDTWIPILGW